MKKDYLVPRFWLFFFGLFFASIAFPAEMSAENWHFLSDVVNGKKTYTMNDRSKLYTTLNWSKDCEESFRAGGSDPQKEAGITQYPLGSKQYLLQVTCGSYAYQSSFIYYFLDLNQKKANLIDFKTVDLDENSKPIVTKTSEVAGEPSFNLGKLTIFSKARGAGGCGSQIVYGFKEGQSYIIEVRARSCDVPMDKAGKFTDPANWPILDVNLK